MRIARRFVSLGSFDKLSYKLPRIENLIDHKPAAFFRQSYWILPQINFTANLGYAHGF